VERYLTSGDFNGFYISEGDPRGPAAETLIRERRIEVVAQDDFPNPHIRPWASRRSVHEQIDSLRNAVAGTEYGVCLYPLPSVLETRDEVKALADRPYTQRLAAGAGQLDVAFFRMDVLEAYRNDPRFRYDFHDFGVRAAVTDEVYFDEREPPADKVSIKLGFAYQQPLGEDRPIVRYVVAFIYDLSRLSPEHQRRWETYEIPGDGIEPHPIWLAEALGHWIDRIGPFDAFFAELAALDELHERAFGARLFRTTTRPAEFGWILRPSQMEFDHFVQALDKLLADNLRHDALDAAGIPRRDENDQLLGTLTRLERVLERARVPEGQRKEVMKPLREIREARSKPAHALRENISSENFVRRQAEALRDVTDSISALRRFWQELPANTDWVPPEQVTAKRLWL
jgi:hypothetical protein